MNPLTVLFLFFSSCIEVGSDAGSFSGGLLLNLQIVRGFYICKLGNSKRVYIFIQCCFDPLTAG